MSLPEEAVEFLQAEEWESPKIEFMTADFSSRQFVRVQRDNKDPRHVILMLAEPDQKTPQFVALSRILRQCGLSAPMVYAARPDQGLVLMEDLGDVPCGRLLDDNWEPKPIYMRATDALVHLHKQFQPEFIGGMELPVFDAVLFTEQAELFLDYYFPFARQRAASKEERISFCDAWMIVLKPMDALPQTLMLRDFMPDNLMDLPNRKDVRNVGILDFQDGGIGPLSYDIASLCEVVRRDGGDEMLDVVIDYYHQQNPIMSLETLRQSCLILAAQRHTRILGIIAKLAENMGRRDKLAYVPRIRKYLSKLLQNETLNPIKVWFNENITPYERI